MLHIKEPDSRRPTVITEAGAIDYSTSWRTVKPAIAEEMQTNSNAMLSRTPNPEGEITFTAVLRPQTLIPGNVAATLGPLGAARN